MTRNLTLTKTIMHYYRYPSTDRESDDDEEDDVEEEEDYSGGRGGQYRDEEDGEEDGPPARRSRRSTKGQRLAFWMGERPVYQKGKMVSGYK